LDPKREREERVRSREQKVCAQKERSYLFDVEAILGLELLDGLGEVEDAQLQLPVLILQILDRLETHKFKVAKGGELQIRNSS
jgi:hypothetical protein